MTPGREYPLHPLVGVGVVITQGDNMLLVKRAANPDKGLWSVPGGLIEVGERATEAAGREVLEETGLVVDVGPRIGVVDKIEYDDSGEVLYHFIIIFYKASVVDGRLNPKDDALEAKWVPINGLKSIPITKSLREILVKNGLYR